MASHTAKEKNIFFRNAYNVVEHMKKIVSYNIADQTYSVSLTRAYCYLRNRVYSYWGSYLECFCFECRLMHLFCQLIVERGNQKYFFHINVHNYDVAKDLEILGAVLVSHM